MIAGEEVSIRQCVPANWSGIEPVREAVGKVLTWCSPAATLRMSSPWCAPSCSTTPCVTAEVAQSPRGVTKLGLARTVYEGRCKLGAVIGGQVLRVTGVTSS